MAITLRPLAELATKFAQRAAGAAPAYASGIKAPRRDWATEAKASEGAYNSGVQAAIAAGNFGKGVASAGTGKWQERASTVGSQRYPQGVSNAGGAWQSGFSPFADVLSRLALPARGNKGAAQNVERVRAVDTAFHDAKGK